MKKKQIIGLVVAALLFTFVSSTSILVNSIVSRNEKSRMELLQSMAKNQDTITLPTHPYVGIVTVDGVIQDVETSSLFGTVESYNHKKTLRYIDQMISSSGNEGIMLYVNSPGGGVYESDELYLKLMEYKEKTGRPIWTYMGNQACSGGYYIAMASDKIYENRNGITGSIGVIMNLVNYKELYEKLGIKQISITSGKNKAMGSAAEDLTKEQREIIQAMVDEPFEQFVDIVANGRGMTVKEVKKIADGRIYTPKQALKLNMIDGIDTYENTVTMMKSEIGKNVEMFKPSRTENPFSSLFGMVSEVKSQSEAEILKEFIENQGSGVPMYYADTALE